MPPKARVTKEMILNTVLGITREHGFENVNARSIAGKLQCSTRPIFTCYENMDELKQDFLVFAYHYYEQYVSEYGASSGAEYYLLLPLSYIQFAQDEPQLFKLLFINDMDLNMTEEEDFYGESGNVTRAGAFAEATGIEPERARRIFLDLFFYTHGIAVLTATGKVSFDGDGAKQMAARALKAFIRQERPDWESPV